MNRHQPSARADQEEVGPREDAEIGVVRAKISGALDEVDEDDERKSDAKRSERAQVGAEQFLELGSRSSQAARLPGGSCGPMLGARRSPAQTWQPVGLNVLAP